MRIKITHNLNDIPKELQRLSDDIVRKATYNATREAARKVRTAYAKLIGQQINLPAGGSSRGERGKHPPGIKSLVQVSMNGRPGRRKPLSAIVAFVGTDPKPISLIHFVTGSKTPPRLVGLHPSQRQKPHVTILKGSPRVLPKKFIQEAKGAVHVWRRIKRRGPDKMIKQVAPSLYKLTEKRRIAAQIKTDIGEYYANRFIHHLRFYAQGGGRRSRPR